LGGLLFVIGHGNCRCHPKLSFPMGVKNIIILEVKGGGHRKVFIVLSFLVVGIYCFIGWQTTTHGQPLPRKIEHFRNSGFTQVIFHMNDNQKPIGECLSLFLVIIVISNNRLR
jgi:hypothetical protein